MNLTIDVGNSVLKLAIFSKNEIVFKQNYPDFELSKLENVHGQFPQIENAIFCSVVTVDDKIIRYCKNNFNLFIELTEKLKLPINVQYKTPETLGKDRIAAVVGAQIVFPKKNILVIDIGTAVTYDFINKKEEYIGGNISPGLNLRYKSLNDHTSKLPLLQISNKQKLLGNNTNSAITAGVENGLLYEIEGYINIFSEKYNDLKVVITGGNASIFENKIKSSIFVLPNLVLTGLNRILEYNAT